MSEHYPGAEAALRVEVSEDNMKHLINQAEPFVSEFEGRERLEGYLKGKTVVCVVGDDAIRHHYACKSVTHWAQGAIGETGFYKLMEAKSGANLVYVCAISDLERLNLRESGAL